MKMEITTQNINAAGSIVLNDLQLLKQIEKYELLYNQNSAVYNKKDFTEWAWERVTKQFLETYENDCKSTSDLFKTEDLQRRWQELKSIITTPNMVSTTKGELHQLIQRLSTYLLKAKENKRLPPIEVYPGFQKLLLEENIKKIEKLTLTQKKELEANVLNFIKSVRAKKQKKPEKKLINAPNIKKQFLQEEKELLTIIREIQTVKKELKNNGGHVSIRNSEETESETETRGLAATTICKTATAPVKKRPLLKVADIATLKAAPLPTSIVPASIVETTFGEDICPASMVEATLGELQLEPSDENGNLKTEAIAEEVATSALYQMPFLMDFASPSERKLPASKKRKTLPKQKPSEQQVKKPENKEVKTTTKLLPVEIAATVPQRVPLDQLANLNLKKLRVRLKRINVSNYNKTCHRPTL